MVFGIWLAMRSARTWCRLRTLCLSKKTNRSLGEYGISVTVSTCISSSNVAFQTPTTAQVPFVVFKSHPIHTRSHSRYFHPCCCGRYTKLSSFRTFCAKFRKTQCELLSATEHYPLEYLLNVNDRRHFAGFVSGLSPSLA